MIHLIAREPYRTKEFRVIQLPINGHRDINERLEVAQQRVLARGYRDLLSFIEEYTASNPDISSLCRELGTVPGDLSLMMRYGVIEIERPLQRSPDYGVTKIRNVTLGRPSPPNVHVFLPKSCTRCNGDLHIYYDRYGKVTSCMQGGHHFYDDKAYTDGFRQTSRRSGRRRIK